MTSITAMLVYNKLFLIIHFLLNCYYFPASPTQVSDELPNNRESISYIIIACDGNQNDNLQNAIELFEKLRNKQISYQGLNVLLISVNEEGDLQPTIFAKTIEQVEEGLREYLCKCSPVERLNLQHKGDEDDSVRNSDIGFLDAVSIIVDRIHHQDNVFLFSISNEYYQLWPNTLKKKLMDRNINVNILRHDNDNNGKIFAPDDSTGNMKKSNEGGIFVYQSNVNANGQSNYIPNQTKHLELTSDHKVESYRKWNLHQNTKSFLNVPVGTWQIFTTLEGRVRKAIMKSPSGMVIDLVPEWYKLQHIQHSSLKNDIADSFINLGLPMQPKVQKWQLLVDGDEYNLTVIVLVDQHTTLDEESTISVIEDHFERRSQSAYENRNEVKRVDIEDTLLRNALGRRRFGFSAVHSPGKILPGPAATEDFRSHIPTSIEVDLVSTIYAFPGEEARIIFIVRNNKILPSIYHFHCFYSQYPCLVRPTRAFFKSQEQIQVTVLVKATGSEGSANIVSLISESVDVTERKVYLYLGRPRSDTRKPDVDYDFVGNCEDADTGKTCHKKKWSVNLWARDAESGLLSFHTEPRELVYSSEFIVGTRDGVNAFYSASCCDPKIDVVASDLRGNICRITLDVQHQHLSFIEITAIVLGSILLIVVVIAVVYGIIRWRKKEGIVLRPHLERTPSPRQMK